VFLKNGYDEKVDWWSLGVLMFECLYGKTPFRGKSRPDIRNAVLKHEIAYPKKSSMELSPECNSALHGFLTQDPAQRLGEPPKSFRNHPFFMSCPWDGMVAKTAVSKFRPDPGAVKQDALYQLEEALMNNNDELKGRKGTLNGKRKKEESEQGSPWFIMREEFKEYDRLRMKPSEEDGDVETYALAPTENPFQFSSLPTQATDMLNYLGVTGNNNPEETSLMNTGVEDDQYVHEGRYDDDGTSSMSVSLLPASGSLLSQIAPPAPKEK
jgi:serine/threonine protein kinase